MQTPNPRLIERRRWRLEERLEASGARRGWFATLAGFLAGVSIRRGIWLLMGLSVLPPPRGGSHAGHIKASDAGRRDGAPKAEVSHPEGQTFQSGGCTNEQ